MSRFLDDFSEFIKNNDGRVFSVPEINTRKNPPDLTKSAAEYDF